MKKSKLIMIMVMQRPGTTALFQILSTAASVIGHEESPDGAIYFEYFLRPESEIRGVIRHSGSSVLLKPVRETERRTFASSFDEYTDYDLNIPWLYRDPVNVAHSYGEMGWSDVTSVALDWVARNRMLVELPRFSHHKVTLLRYESLIGDRSVLKFLNRKLGIRAYSTLRRDSHTGRTRMSIAAQARVDAITAVTVQELDRLPISGRGTGQKEKWKLGVPQLAARIGSRVPATPLPSGLDEPGEVNEFRTVPKFEAERFRLEPYCCLRRWREGRSRHYGALGNVWFLSGYNEVSRELEDSTRIVYQTSRLLEESRDPEREQFRDAIAVASRVVSADRIVARLESVAFKEIRRQTADVHFDLAHVRGVAVDSMLYQLLGVNSDGPDGFFERTNQGETMDSLSASFLPEGWLSVGGTHSSLGNAELHRFVRFGSYFHHVIAMCAASAVHFLLGAPSLLEKIRREPDRFPAAFTELMRLTYPILAVKRWTNVDAAGSVIPAHHLVYLAIGAANRDPAAFERPEEFVAGRLSTTPTKSLTGYSNVSFALSYWEDLGHLVCQTFLKVLLTACPNLEPVHRMGETKFTVTQCRGPFREILQIPVTRYLPKQTRKFATT